MKLTNERLEYLLKEYRKSAVPFQVELVSALQELVERRKDPSPRGAFTALMKELQQVVADAELPPDVWVAFHVRLDQFTPYDAVNESPDVWRSAITQKEPVGGLVIAKGRSGEEALRRLPPSVRVHFKEVITKSTSHCSCGAGVLEMDHHWTCPASRRPK